MGHSGYHITVSPVLKVKTRARAGSLRTKNAVFPPEKLAHLLTCPSQVPCPLHPGLEFPHINRHRPGPWGGQHCPPETVKPLSSRGARTRPARPHLPSPECRSKRPGLGCFAVTVALIVGFPRVFLFKGPWGLRQGAIAPGTNAPLLRRSCARPGAPRGGDKTQRRRAGCPERDQSPDAGYWLGHFIVP